MDKSSNWEEQKLLSIEDADDYRNKIEIAYDEWKKNDFSEIWIESYKNSWCQCTDVSGFIKLLKAKKTLSKSKYKQKENKIIAEFEEISKIVKETVLVIEAEEEAFKKAGIQEGRVEYKCPICGGTAIANRYIHDDRYHGLGSGCPTCGTSHS